MSDHELADFDPETGHLHTCLLTWRPDYQPCDCAAHLYAIAQDEVLARPPAWTQGRPPFEQALMEVLAKAGPMDLIGGHEGGHRIIRVEWQRPGYSERAADIEDATPFFYADTGEQVAWTGEKRACALCARPRNDTDPDPCLGMVDGLWVACCGHGVLEQAYVGFREGGVLRETAALTWLADERGVGPFAAPGAPV